MTIRQRLRNSTLERGMLLSIIVPVYNVQDYLSRCVDSLLKTDARLEYEIILVDDGSTDKSSILCDEYSSKFDYIKTFHKENGGLSDARNFGLNHAVGTYIAFIDSDDYVEQGSIEILYHQIKEEQCDIYCCDYYRICGSIRKNIQYMPIDTVMTGADFLRYQLKNHTMISTVVQNVYRRSFLLENNLFFKKGIYHEDEEWTPRVFLTASSVKYLKTVFYVYFIRENSITQQKDLTKHIKDFISTMKTLLQTYEGEIDDELFWLLKDILVDKYLAKYALGNFGKGTKEIVLSRAFLLKGLVHKKTKMKTRLFTISRRLYCRISRRYNARALKKYGI